MADDDVRMTRGPASAEHSVATRQLELGHWRTAQRQQERERQRHAARKPR